MSNPNTFSTSRLNNSIYPLTYSVKTKYDINVLYFTVASVDDAYKFMRDRANAYLYIFDVGHYMTKDGIYLTLKEILENSKIDPEYIYEDDIIVIKKEKFAKFLSFPQYDFKMFDYDRVMDDAEFTEFYKPAAVRLKNFDTFLDIKNRLPRYFISCHDNSLLYCETRDMDLKCELLREMLRGFFEVYIEKNHKTIHDIDVPSKDFADDLYNKNDKITIREDATNIENNNIEASIFDADGKAAGKLIYRTDKKEWVAKV